MKLFDNIYLRRIVYIIQIMTTAILMIMAFTIQLIPMKYLIIMMTIMVILLIGEYFLIFTKKKNSKRSLLTQLVSLILSCVMIVGSFYFYKTGATVDLMTNNNFQTRAFSVIVLKDSKIKNEKQLPDQKLGYIPSIDPDNMSYAVSQIHQGVGNINVQDYKDFQSLLTALYDQKIDALILDEAFRLSIDDIKDTFDDDTRVVYQVIKDEETINAKSVDVTQKPFLVFISGNDQYGSLSAVSRSDVNMLVGVNPQTKQILLISIPRDTYYPLHRNKQLDKFTHAGIYGLQESIDTLQDMIHEDINYYARLNFTSFMKVVDALGGITINSPQEFTTKIGKYKIKKGVNHLNAKQALAFVRERKSFLEGDFERGKNQQRMIAAIVKKIASPAILTSFVSVLDSVSQSIETNLSKDDMNALIHLQLEQMPDWDIQSYQITGTPASRACYSMGGVFASVVIPDQKSIEQTTTYIDQFMAGQKVQIESSDLGQ